VKTPDGTEPRPGTRSAGEGASGAILSEILEPLCETLESGILVVDQDRRIVVCSLAMSVMFGKTPEELVGMSIPAFNEFALSMMDDPPKLLQASGLFPTQSTVLCEEFELSRPSRTVARWIARRVRCPFYALVAAATDITADVDLTSAYEKMAITDRLTGLMNRRGLERDIRHEVLRLRRYQTPISFVLLDIDHFKAINDAHGHVAGDAVLRQVATAIASAVRETDLVARWGGEEFLVALPETAYAGALICAEKIRVKVASASEQIGFPVTISGGVYQPGPGESISDLVTRADARLYEAKRTGRNRIC
jgi:diguanylate cyclase (GGDEF)-like protein